MDPYGPVWTHSSNILNIWIWVWVFPFDIAYGTDPAEILMLCLESNSGIMVQH